MAAVLLLMFCLSAARGAFDVTPVSQKVAVGVEAEFRCRHPTADAIRWRVNGSLVGRSPPPDITPNTIRDDNGNLLDTLTITARPEYNGTEVVCVARFDNGSPNEQTEPATLLVLLSSLLPTLRPVAPGLVLAPVSQNVAVGATVCFACQPTNGDVFWRINGESLSEYPAASSSSRGSLNTLTIRNVSADYDGAVISCLVLFDISIRELAGPALLLVQGQLAAVSSLSVDRNSSTLLWAPPPSLDLTGIEPDIVYCVDVYNITCGRRDLIVSDCNVTEPSYTSDVTMDGYIYEYIVTPRSNVLGAKNGTPSQPFRDQFITLSMNSPHLTAEGSSLTYEAELTYNVTSNRQVPSTCTLFLKSLDGLSDDRKTISCNRDRNSINLDVPPRRLWKCALLANGCPNDSILVDEPELSTHDVHNILVTSPRVGSVTVTGTFFQGSTAIGVLIIITAYSTSDTQYHLCRRDGNDMRAEDTISGLAGGSYKVSAFVFEESGYPVNRTATEPRSVDVMNGSESTPSSTVSYDLHSNSTHVCVTCTFLTNSPTGCLAVVHQRISQLISGGLMNIASSHKFTRSGDTAYGCIQTNLKGYQVGVVDGLLVADVPEEGSSSVCTGQCVAVIAVLAFVMLTVSPLVFVAIVLMYRKILKNRKDDTLEASVYIMEEESARGNLYEDNSSSMSSRVELTAGETMRLISTRRVEFDGHGPESSDSTPSLDNSPLPPTSSPPVIPQAAAGGESQQATRIVYSELDRRPNPDSSAPPPQGDEPQYSTVNNFKNSQGVTYACHVIKSSSTTTRPVVIDDSTKTLSPYSVVIHPPAYEEKTRTTATPATAVTSNKLERPASPFAPSPPAPCTVENLVPLLHSVASIWQRLGEALSLDEDDLDMIYTNNETDEACLQDMLEFYEKKSGSQHTWEEIVTVLKKIGQKEVAEKIQGLHVEPCVYGGWSNAPKEAVQPTTQEIPKKDGIVHVHNSGPKFQPKDLKKPVTFQHLDCGSAGVTVDENQNVSGRELFLTGGVLAHVSHSDFRSFTYEQDSYFKISLGHEDHTGDDKEFSYVHSTASSTITHEYAFKLRQLAEKVNVGECLWQIRAQALSQEGSQDHLSDSVNYKKEDCPNPETMLNKRLRGNKESKLRINFQRFQETTR